MDDDDVFFAIRKKKTIEKQHGKKIRSCRCCQVLILRLYQYLPQCPSFCSPLFYPAGYVTGRVSAFDRSPHRLRHFNASRMFQ